MLVIPLYLLSMHVGYSPILTFNVVYSLLQQGFHRLGVNVKDDGFNGRAARDGGTHVGILFLELLPQPIKWLHLRAFRNLKLKIFKKSFKTKNCSCLKQNEAIFFSLLFFVLSKQQQWIHPVLINFLVTA